MLPATILVVKGNSGSRPPLAGTVALELGILGLARKKHCFSNSSDTMGNFVEANSTFKCESKEQTSPDELNKKVLPTTSAIPKCILKYKGVFRKKLGKHENIKVKLHIDPTITPVAQPPSKIPYGYQDKLSEHLKKLKDDDIIEDARMNEPTTWISNLVFSPKPRDPDPVAVRICLDSRVPNAAIKGNKHDIPSVQDILLDINGATFFSPRFECWIPSTRIRRSVERYYDILYT